MTRIARIHTIDDARRTAARRIPKMIFDFVDGGADGEVTLRANRSDFERVRLLPRVLVNVAERHQAVSLFGQELALPVVLGPAGLAGVVGGGGERAVGRAAARFGSAYVLSTGASASIEEVAAATPGRCWFQLYPWGNQEVVDSLVERAARAGCPVLVVTVDSPVVGKRVRDLHNGAVLPPRPGVRSVLDAALRPRWATEVLAGPRLTFANLKGFAPDDNMVIGEYVSKHLANPAATWDLVARVRDAWSGPLVVKGLITAIDALEALECGADGVVVSNHGGRQLDGSPSTISALPAIAAAVGGRAKVLVDSGIRTGGDVVKALALGADACMVARPYLWGLAAGGEAGVHRVLEIFADEIDRALALIGIPRSSALDGQAVSFPTEWAGRPPE